MPSRKQKAKIKRNGTKKLKETEKNKEAESKYVTTDIAHLFA